MSFVGFLFSIIAVASCSFVSVDGFGLGIFRGYDNFAVGSPCMAYTSSSNGAQSAAQAFGVISAVVSGINFILLITMLCWKITPVLQKILAGSFMFLFCSQLLTLLFIKATNEAANGLGLAILSNVGAGAVMAILASLIFLTCGVLMIVLPPLGRNIIDACESSRQNNVVGPKASQPGAECNDKEGLPPPV